MPTVMHFDCYGEQSSSLSETVVEKILFRWQRVDDNLVGYVPMRVEMV